MGKQAQILDESGQTFKVFLIRSEWRPNAFSVSVTTEVCFGSLCSFRYGLYNNCCHQAGC